MVGTIRPVVYRKHRHWQWVIGILLYMLGSTVGGMSVGMVVAAFGNALVIIGLSSQCLTLAVVSLGGLMYLSSTYGWLPMPQPQRKNQVPQAWRQRFHPWIASLLYGASLGTGITTPVISRGVYVLVIGLLFVQSVPATILVAGVFGLTRALPVLMFGVRTLNVRDGESMTLALNEMMSFQPKIFAAGQYAFLGVVGAWVVALLYIMIAHGTG